MEFAFLFGFATLIMALMFLYSYTFHFEQVTFNCYTNGKVNVTTDGALALAVLTCLCSEKLSLCFRHLILAARR